MSNYLPIIRSMSMVSQLGSMTYEQACDAQQKILWRIEAPDMRNTWNGIRNAQADIMTRWQGMLGLFIPMQMEIIKEIREENSPHNPVFEPDQSGLFKFNLACTFYSREEEGLDPAKLTSIIEQRWAFLLDNSFGIHHLDIKRFGKLRRDKARELALTSSSAQQAPSFLKKLDEIVKENPDTTVRRQAVMALLLSLHMDILKGFGFPGENGYILAQVQLMEHSDDIVVIRSITEATHAVMQRAQIMH